MGAVRSDVLVQLATPMPGSNAARLVRGEVDLDQAAAQFGALGAGWPGRADGLRRR